MSSILIRRQQVPKRSVMRFVYHMSFTALAGGRHTKVIFCILNNLLVLQHAHLNKAVAKSITVECWFCNIVTRMLRHAHM
jgi:hypothetical protein